MKIGKMDMRQDFMVKKHYILTIKLILMIPKKKIKQQTLIVKLLLLLVLLPYYQVYHWL
jgi:hypothetical protein